MVVALGFWAAAIGYALVYTGVQWFTGGNGSLAQNLGLSTTLTPAALKTTAPTPAAVTASGAIGDVTAGVGSGGASGTGYPSSTDL